MGGCGGCRGDGVEARLACGRAEQLHPVRVAGKRFEAVERGERERFRDVLFAAGLREDVDDGREQALDGNEQGEMLGGPVGAAVVRVRARVEEFGDEGVEGVDVPGEPGVDALGRDLRGLPGRDAGGREPAGSCGGEQTRGDESVASVDGLVEQDDEQAPALGAPEPMT